LDGARTDRKKMELFIALHARMPVENMLGDVRPKFANAWAMPPVADIKQYFQFTDERRGLPDPDSSRAARCCQFL